MVDLHVGHHLELEPTARQGSTSVGRATAFTRAGDECSSIAADCDVRMSSDGNVCPLVGVEEAMIDTRVLFGATGDLAGRYLLPAVAALRGAGQLPDGFQVIGAARGELDDEGFRRFASARLDRHAAEVPVPVRDALVRSLRYRQVDLDDPASVAPALGGGDLPIAVYLALPQQLKAGRDTLGRSDCGEAAGLMGKRSFRIGQRVAITSPPPSSRGSR